VNLSDDRIVPALPAGNPLMGFLGLQPRLSHCGLTVLRPARRERVWDHPKQKTGSTRGSFRL